MPKTLEAQAVGVGNVSEDFVDAGWWPYFKEHVNRDGVKFGREAMQRICDRCNERIDESGDYAPLVLQHTRDDDPNFHPEYVGLVGPYRLGKIGQKNPKWAIFGRERVRKSKVAAVKECPRRSVEYWADKEDPTNGYFDPISALPASVTPELDLGIHYQADPRDGSRMLVRYQKVSRYEATAVASGGTNTYVPGGTEEKKDRYQADGSLSPQDLQQIIVALSPIIKQAVEELGATLRPQGADPDHLLSPDTDGGLPGSTDLDQDADDGEFAADDADFEGGGDEVSQAEEPVAGDEGGAGEAGPGMGETQEDEGEEPDEFNDFGKKLKGKKPAQYAKEPHLASALAHYEKLCQYEAADDEGGAEMYWKELDDESREHVRSFADNDEDEPRGRRMRERYMATCETPHGAKYMADTTNAELIRYQKENADYRKENERLKGELSETRTKYQKEVDARRASDDELQAIRSRVEKIEAEGRRAVRYSKLKDLQTTGYAFDLEGEAKDCDELSDVQFDRHLDRIRTNYQKVPATLGQTGLRIAATPQLVSQKDRENQKLERYSKVAEDNVKAARRKNEKLDYQRELKRLMKDDPEKIDAA